MKRNALPWFPKLVDKKNRNSTDISWKVNKFGGYNLYSLTRFEIMWHNKSLEYEVGEALSP